MKQSSVNSRQENHKTPFPRLKLWAMAYGIQLVTVFLVDCRPLTDDSLTFTRMGKFFESIQPAHQTFIEKQKMFFVGTAPLGGEGHVNLSPKGLDSFRVLSASRIVYMDLIGSGNETSAHLLENGRITFMFCAFDGPPNILRLYGSGRTVLPDSDEWNKLAAHFEVLPMTRQFIVADVHQVQTSCGFNVPLYDYAGERDHATKWAQKKGSDGLKDYMQEKNRVSLDGLPTALSLV